MVCGLLGAAVVGAAVAANDLSAKFLPRYERRCQRAFRRRMTLNSLMRFAVYRPALMDPLVRLFSRRRGLLDSLVGLTCAPEPLG